MSEFSFQLTINCDYPEKRTESIICTALLRSVPGRRKVFDALWNNRNVIMKVFTHKLSSRRHVRREWKGLTVLQNRNINAPVPLFFGKTDTGDWAVIEEKIAFSSTILEILDNTQNQEKKLELLIMICRELALQHKTGVLQKDFHLENFIFAEGKIYTLDPAQMRFFKHDVPKKKSISNLSMLLLYLPGEDTESQNILCKEYYHLREWRFEDSQKQSIQKEIDFQRKRGINRGLKKCLRTSKRILRIKNRNITAVLDNTFCGETEALDFIKQIDSLMTKGHILKNGNTCFVSYTTWNNKNIVIKRYNHKSLIHSLRHSIMYSRARHVWLHTQRLTMLGIPTPKPLIYVEHRKGLLVWNSYIVTEYVEGTNFYNYLRDKSISENQCAAAKKQVDNLLEKMGKFQITHGDLKHSNILITPNGPILTDLDAMKVHKSGMLYKMRREKDIERFNRSD